MKKILVFLSCLSGVSYAQTRLVLDGAYITIGNGANMVVDNANTNAITRNSGHIISEAENSNVVWNVGVASGTYTIPFGFGTTDYIPLVLTKNAGTGAGNFTFATYKTSTWQNSLNLPAGVPNVNNSSGSDNSANLIDRFWKINASGYTVKPDLTNLTFTYRDIEHSVASNTITEVSLIPQRYNTTATDWGDFLPASTINTTTNEVTIASLSNTHLFPWWTLTSSISPLPVELVDFQAVLNNSRTVDLTWTTLSEINNDYFVVQRSVDGFSWQNLTLVDGNGTTSVQHDYACVDEYPSNGITYYRLQQVDFDGAISYSVIRSVSLSQQENVLVLPNPFDDQCILYLGEKTSIKSIEIINALGQLVQQVSVETADQKNVVLDFSKMASGMYYLKADGVTMNQKLIKR